MAMIECPECGRMVSDEATTCPECGYPVGGHPRNSRRRHQQRRLTPPVAQQAMSLRVWLAFSSQDLDNSCKAVSDEQSFISSQLVFCGL